MKLSRSSPGTNVKDYLLGLGIKVKPTKAARSSHRPKNVVFGRSRTIARLLKHDQNGLTIALRCIQASDPSALQSFVVLAVYRFLAAHMTDAEFVDVLAVFGEIRLGHIRDRAMTLCRGKSGKASAARIDGIYYLLADQIISGAIDGPGGPQT